MKFWLKLLKTSADEFLKLIALDTNKFKLIKFHYDLEFKIYFSHFDHKMSHYLRYASYICLSHFITEKIGIINSNLRSLTSGLKALRLKKALQDSHVILSKL